MFFPILLSVKIGVFNDGISKISKLFDVEHPYVFLEFGDLKQIKELNVSAILILTKDSNFDVSSIPKTMFTLYGLQNDKKFNIKNANIGKTNMLIKTALNVWAKKVRLNVKKL